MPACSNWAALTTVGKESAAKAERQAATAAGQGRLTRQTLATIRSEDIAVGARHRLFYSAAASIAELLTDVGLDAGLLPSDVRRQIELLDRIQARLSCVELATIRGRQLAAERLDAALATLEPCDASRIGTGSRATCR